MTDINKSPSHYIGIGASAGGLEALQEFFSHLPCTTGAAFIVVQHLSPDFKSMMPELLSKHTKMPIYQVVDGMSLESNCIYLMPARKNMLIGEGKLLLSDEMPSAQSRMPIDIFLRSLAEDQQHKAIAIVLSGTGSDGTRGIKSMKEAGGLVIVQEPTSAKFDGMPISAYNTGLADMLLAPKDMGTNLVKFIEHPAIAGGESSLKYSVGENDDTLVEIFQLLKRRSSINFSQYKASTVARRIERRISINHLTTLESYLRLLIESPKEVQILSKELLIGVTRFFRDDEAFSKIISDVAPKIVTKANNQNEIIRLWVAGCSSGEEAYSLAILFDEEIKARGLNCSLKIFATDVDENAIAVAGNGIYPIDIKEEISQQRLDEYFIEKDGHYCVSQSLRQMVIFASHNMIDDPPFSNIDLISCRNVLIYFQHAAQKKVLSSLYFALKKDGYLFLGGSESLGDLKTHFETIHERSRIFMKVSNMRIPVGNTPPIREASTHYVPSGLAMAPVNNIVKPTRNGARHHMDVVLERLISEYAPDCIVINDMFEAIHVYGDVSAYVKGVKSGKVSTNIKDIIVDELSVAISTALYRSEKNAEDVFYKDITLTIDDEQNVIDLSIFYIKSSDKSMAAHFFIIQFITHNLVRGKALLAPKISFNATEQSRQRIKDLEQELIKKQEHLQVTIEELETTNEELQSTNEELMSANEELQSTNEELQSVNEELYSVNSEYQEKIGQLTEANDDLDSVISATDIGILFLDEQLTIRKFTPTTTQYIHLRISDIGRPFHHISHELIYDNLLADISHVSSSGELIERDIMTKQEQALLIRITPYHKQYNKNVNGIIITLTNISRQRFVESALKKSQDQLRNSLLDRSEYLHRQITKQQELRLLLLDDDEIDRLRILRLLGSITERKFEIDEFSDIDDAIKAIQKNMYDICLVDYQLEGATAKDFTLKLEELNMDTPVVILSGYSEIGLDSDFMNSDVFDFLNKEELSSHLLLRSIDYVIERKVVRKGN